jgi:hypothetical protein
LVGQLAQQVQALEARGQALVAGWRQRFPKASLPLTLVRLAGESNTLLRWRCSGAGYVPRGGRFELADRPEFLAALAPAVRSRILDIEHDRIALNYEYALAAYAHARLLQLESHRLAVAQLRQGASGAKPAPTRTI